jgi:geranylgeranyl reductase family protein
MKDCDILIVGAGPAGSAAAIQIANLDPALARRTVVIEKASFPRPKLCGGGITPFADQVLNQLDVAVDVPFLPIHKVRCIYKEKTFTIRGKNLFRVVRREEFDAALARSVRERGVELCEDEPLLDFQQDGEGVTVQTRHRTYRAKIMIGADGANSIVRQKLGLVRWDRISRLMEILTPVDATQAPEFVGNMAVFDFTLLSNRVQGYFWDFPSFKKGVALMNRGVFDSRVHSDKPRADLKQAFAESLSRRLVELDEVQLQGHPERWYDHGARHSAPRILLAGDAAGTEPLLGEGISYALNFGMMAGDSAVNALSQRDFTLLDYDRRVAWSALGIRLRLKRAVAGFVYGDRGDWFYRAGWAIGRTVFGK